MLGAIEKEKLAKNFSVAPSTQKGSKKDQQRRPRSTSSTKISICRCARVLLFKQFFVVIEGNMFFVSSLLVTIETRLISVLTHGEGATWHTKSIPGKQSDNALDFTLYPWGEIHQALLSTSAITER